MTSLDMEARNYHVLDLNVQIHTQNYDKCLHIRRSDLDFPFKNLQD